MTVVERMTTLKIDASRFERVKDDYRRTLINFQVCGFFTAPNTIFFFKSSGNHALFIGQSAVSNMQLSFASDAVCRQYFHSCRATWLP
jgi:hypothetical protein